MAFKMKGPSLYQNGALGKNLNVQKNYAGQADGRATSSPFQQKEGEKQKDKEKPKLNQFGETPEQYKKRMEEMGLRKPDKKAPPTKQTAKQSAKLPKAIVNAIAKKEGKSPLEQRLSSTKGGGEGQDQDKIFNKKGEHVGDYKNGKKVMHTKAQHDKMTKPKK
jgi:hypothetical protein